MGFFVNKPHCGKLIKSIGLSWYNVRMAVTAAM